MPDHPKLRAVGPLGIALEVAAICYSNRLRTDGFIPAEVAQNLVALKRPKYTIDKLLKEGLWEEVAGGYRLHDYHDYQATRQEIEALSRDRSRAGRAGAESRWKKSDRMANAMASANGKRHGKTMAHNTDIYKESTDEVTRWLNQ